MHNNSIFIGIAVDNFSDRLIKPLNYCESDLKSIYRLFHTLNFCKARRFLINENAKKSNIVSVINEYSGYEDPLIIFLSSHGERVGEDSFIFCNDTDINSIEESSLSLRELLHQLSFFSSLSINLFLDSCDINLNGLIPSSNLTIHYPEKLISHESSRVNHSIYVKRILKEYSKKKYFNFNDPSKTKRFQKVRQNISSCFAKGFKLVCITGDSGLGKSYFLRQIVKLEDNTFYVSIPKISGFNFDLILNLLAQEVSNKTSFIHDVDPKRFLLFYDSIHPYSLFIVDHIDHLPEKVANTLISFLTTLKSQTIVCSRKAPPAGKSCKVLPLPVLRDEDLDDIYKELHIDPNSSNRDKLLAGNMSYIEVLQNFYHISFSAQILINKTVYAILASGGYIHEPLFIKHFDIDLHELNDLKKMGVLIFHDGFYYPHDRLYDNANFDHVQNLSNNAYEYWKEELLVLNIKSIHQFILILKSFSPEFNQSDSNLFKDLINKLNGKQNQHFLLLLYDYLCDQELDVDLIIALSNSIIDIGKFELAYNLLKKDNREDPAVNVLKAECLWWEGRFQETIELVDYSLINTSMPLEKSHLLCSRGIAFFFLGKWDKAINDLNLVVQNKISASNKSLFLAYCVLATIYGIRGTDFTECTINFIAAIKIASKLKNFSWIAIAYGNIGEIFWKAGMIDSSIKTLELADSLSNLSGNDALNLEINRNLLHAYNRSDEKSKSHKHIKKIENVYQNSNQTYVKMQLLNSMITYYVLNEDKKYSSLIFEANEATKENMEYQIYTQANLALVSIANQDIENAAKKLNLALELCNEGSNWLAMKQIMDDWDDLIKKRTMLESYESKLIFPKWYQKLEIKLSPYLHHLGHLNEYLGQSYTSL